MKLLYIPLDYHRHKESPELFTDILEAFSVYYNAAIFTSMEEALDFKPDIIFFQGSLTVEQLDFLRKETKAKVYMWTGDCRYIPQQSLMMYKDYVDAFLLPFEGHTLSRYEMILGKPCYFLWEPIQKWRFRENRVLSSGYTVFAGNLYDNLPGGESRPELMSFINKHVPNLKIYGSFPGCSTVDNAWLPDLYNDAYIVIAENNIHDIESYFTPRNIGAIAAGSCVAMRYFPRIEKYFIDGVDCFIYRHKYELLDIIKFLESNPQIRNNTANNAYSRAVINFTPVDFARKFFSIHSDN